MKTCIFDLETFNLDAQTGIGFCCSWSSYDSGKVNTIRADSFKGWNKSRTVVQRPWCEAVLKALDEYDIFVAHNGLWFDRPMLISWALKYNLPLFMRFSKFVDPVQIARRHLRLARNNLQAVLDFLGIEEEKTHIEWDHWTKAAYDGNRQSMDYIVEHCEADVVALDRAHHKIRRLIKDINERGSAF